ncbi:MAG: DNA-binding response OmpR family regulator [Acidimicrobiales bacterium]|jgi:DNA-binding response OmpR family regulator
MRVLVVEDEEKIRIFLKKSLEAECFAVDAVSDGNEGLELALLNEYDIILLDNVLPNKTGLEICSDIRHAGKMVPIIMLSVRSETDIKVRALNAGADDYLTKPFSFEELVARVHALLRRPAILEEEILTISDVTLDTKQHVVTRRKEEIKLTRKEFMLLEYLMKNEGIVLSRGMLMEHVWDMNADPFSNTIESHILSLRRKLGHTKRNDLIQTVPGRGYKIMP